MKAVSCVLALLMAGCATVVSNVTTGLSEDVSSAILDNDDIEVVREGAPAYLILIDGFLANSPEDADLLLQAATLNSAYAGAFVTDPERARLMHGKAKSLAERGVCARDTAACALSSVPFDEFEAWVGGLGEADVDAVYTLGTTWAGWIQANQDDYSAIAELARVKAIMARVAEVAPAHDFGGAYLYLGVFETLLPPALGGKPEVGREYFERAVELSDGKHLMTKVMFADSYARLVFDRALHDELLGEVLESPAEQPGLTLINTVAQARAEELLGSADDYF